MHNIEFVTYPENCNREHVMEDIREDAGRNGDGYWSSFTWHHSMTPFESYEKARQWIERDNSSYNDHAVKYYTNGKFKKSKKLTDLEKRLTELEKKQEEYTKAHSVKTFKAEFVGCPLCGSKLARKRLKDEKCPLCYTDLRGKTTLETIANYERRRKEVDSQIKEEKKKMPSELRWLVKYEYHC